jgi:hypothetical protein
MKPGTKRVDRYSQESRDLSIKAANPEPKPRKVRQSFRQTRKQEDADPIVGALVLFGIVAVALFLIGLTR